VQACSPCRRQVLNILSFVCATLLLLPVSLYGEGPHAKTRVKTVASKLPAPGQIKHVVFIMKENRSFDHYFGQFPGADGTTTGLISTGQTIPLWRAPDVMLHDGDHSRLSGLTAEDGGKMDHFDLSNEGNENGDFQAYTQMTQADIPNYWAYAQNFVLSDHTFESDLSASYSAHFFSIAATGEGTVTVPQVPTGGLDAWGCDTKPDALITVLDAAGAYYDTFPCFNPQTLADSLNNASLSWKFYGPPYPEGGYGHSAFDYVKHIRYSQYWKNNVVDYHQFVSDALAGNLPAVSWIIADSTETEHPPNATCHGENWTVEQINAIMQGPSEQWDSTVIFVTWDEWGGFYDHIMPPQVDQWGFGIRVPMLIISPYPAQQGYVTHTTYEFSSVVKFIEEVFSLPYLTQRDQNANDTTDSFNFDQSPQAPLYLQPRSCPVASTTMLPYGDVVVNNSKIMAATLTNWGTSTMSIGDITVTGDYKHAGGTCGSTLASGSSCKVNVGFKPKAAGPLSGTLTINDSDPTSPQTVSLNGTGTFLELPIRYPGLTFSQTFLGSNRQQQVQLSNTGSAAITINQVQTAGDYSESDNCVGNLGAGSSCQITVTFTPTSSGYRFGNLIIWDSDPGSPHQARLQGGATAVERRPTTLSFSTPVGQTSEPKQVTVTNRSNASLFLESATVATPFNQTNNCPTQLAAGKQCTISVTFTPTKQGEVKSTLYINDADLFSPQRIALTGTGD